MLWGDSFVVFRHMIEQEGTVVMSRDNSVRLTCATIVETLLFGSCWFSVDTFLIIVVLSRGCSLQQNIGLSFSEKNINYRIN